MLSSRPLHGKRKHWGLILPLFLAALMFCAVPAPVVGAAELKAELVNKTDESNVATVLTGQVQLTYPDGRTQLLPYRSHLQPVAAGGKVYIFTTKDAKLTGIVIYDSAKGRGQAFPLPDDLKKKPAISQPSFSPDGTKVAYYFVSEPVKKSPSGEQSPPLEGWFIDRTGKTVNPPVTWQKKSWPQPEQFSEGLAQVGEAKGSDVSQVKKKRRKKRIRIDWSISRSATTIVGKIGFQDATGTVVIPPQFERAGYFSEGLAPVEVSGKWGFIDKTGTTVIPPHYDFARSFSEGMAAVYIRDNLGYGWLGFIDKTGNMVIPPQFSRAGNFSEGLAWAQVEGKYGFIDRSGIFLIPPQYDNAEDFSQGVAPVKREGGEIRAGGGVRLRSWPDWRLLWQSPLCELARHKAPPFAPIWQTNSLVEFDQLFFDPPWLLKYQVPEPGKSDEAKTGDR